MRCFGGAGRNDRIIKVASISLIVIAAYYISKNWYQLALIRGESMYPAYHNMQLVMIDKWSGRYSYGDVISFQCDQLDSVLIKRIVACPGDQVVIKNGLLYVNNAVSGIFPEEYIFEYAGIAEDFIYLGANQYFVIGDNLKESKDSRYEDVGVVCEENIGGKIIPQRLYTLKTN